MARSGGALVRAGGAAAPERPQPGSGSRPVSQLRAAGSVLRNLQERCRPSFAGQRIRGLHSHPREFNSSDPERVIHNFERQNTQAPPSVLSEYVKALISVEFRNRGGGIARSASSGVRSLSSKDGVLGTASAPFYMVPVEKGQIWKQLWSTSRTIAATALVVYAISIKAVAEDDKSDDLEPLVAAVLSTKFSECEGS